MVTKYSSIWCIITETEWLVVQALLCVYSHFRFRFQLWVPITCNPRARKQTRKTHFGKIDCAHSAALCWQPASSPLVRHRFDLRCCHTPWTLVLLFTIVASKEIAFLFVYATKATRSKSTFVFSMAVNSSLLLISLSLSLSLSFSNTRFTWRQVIAIKHFKLSSTRSVDKSEMCQQIWWQSCELNNFDSLLCISHYYYLTWLLVRWITEPCRQGS